MKKISAKDYIALVTIEADRTPGDNRAAAWKRAQGVIDKSLAGKGVAVDKADKAALAARKIGARLNTYESCGWDSGAFWSKVKETAASAFRTSKPYLPYALPLVSASAAAPFVLKAMAAKRAAAAAKRGESPKGAPPPPPPAESDDDEKPAEGSQETPDNVNVVGYAAKRLRSSNMGDASMPHDLYRAAIWQRALKLSGSKHPGSQAMAKAHLSVTRDLKTRGVSLGIPGGRPGRVTR